MCHGCREIKEEIVKGRMDPEAAFINARMVPDAFIVHVAGRSVIGSNKDGKLKTRSLHAELVFCISASKHVRSALLLTMHTNKCILMIKLIDDWRN